MLRDDAQTVGRDVVARHVWTEQLRVLHQVPAVGRVVVVVEETRAALRVLVLGRRAAAVDRRSDSRAQLAHQLIVGGRRHSTGPVLFPFLLLLLLLFLLGGHQLGVPLKFLKRRCAVVVVEGVRLVEFRQQLGNAISHRFATIRARRTQQLFLDWLDCNGLHDLHTRVYTHRGYILGSVFFCHTRVHTHGRYILQSFLFHHIRVHTHGRYILRSFLFRHIRVHTHGRYILGSFLFRHIRVHTHGGYILGSDFSRHTSVHTHGDYIVGSVSSHDTCVHTHGGYILGSAPSRHTCVHMHGGYTLGSVSSHYTRVHTYRGYILGSESSSHTSVHTHGGYILGSEASRHTCVHMHGGYIVGSAPARERWQVASPCGKLQAPATGRERSEVSGQKVSRRTRVGLRGRGRNGGVSMTGTAGGQG